MNLSLGSKIAAGFSVALLLTILVAAATVWSVARFESTSLSVNHTHEVLFHLGRVEIDVLNVQTGSRGFILTNDERFLEPFESGIGRVRESLRELRLLVSDNLSQLNRLDRLDEYVAAEIAIMERGISLRRTGGLVVAAAFVASGEGRDAVNRIRGVIQEMIAIEEALLAQRFTAARRVARTITSAVIGGSLLTIVVATLAMIIVRRDLRTRAEVEAALEKNRATFVSLFENAADSLVVVDQGGRIVRVNRRTEQLFGYPRQELVGQPVELLMPERFRDAHVGLRTRYQDAPAHRAMGAGLHLLGRNHDGSEFPVDIMLSPLQTETEGHVVLATIRDITARRAAEQKITRLNADLRLQNAQLEAVNRELESFSYSVSHDLRAPLRHIDGFAHLLQSHAPEALDETAQRYLDKISSAARQMGRLIDDLLEFSRMGRTQLRAMDIDMNALVSEVVNGSGFDRNGKKIDWQIAPLPPTRGDATMFRVVWLNLIDNAVKYSGKQSHPRIEIGSQADAEKESITYFVRDNGVGFDMNYANKLFGVFQRLHASTDFQGTGIGLANVQRVIARHGGRVWGEGKVGGGAVFYFSLPVMPGASASGSAESISDLNRSSLPLHPT